MYHLRQSSIYGTRYDSSDLSISSFALLMKNREHIRHNTEIGALLMSYED
jgi:hypothetical protein